MGLAGESREHACKSWQKQSPASDMRVVGADPAEYVFYGASRSLVPTTVPCISIAEEGKCPVYRDSTRTNAIYFNFIVVR